MFAHALFFLALTGGDPNPLTQPAPAKTRLNQLFEICDKTKAGTKTLVVEFKMESFDKSFNVKTHFEGTVKYRRTAAGTIQARYELRLPGESKKGNVCWLLDDRLYWGSLEKKEVWAKDLKNRGILEFIALYDPFFLFLDRGFATKKLQLEVAKDDRQCTYISFSPSSEKNKSWWGCVFDKGRLVLTKEDTKHIPVGMPRQFWLEQPDGSEVLVDFHSWRFNDETLVRDEDFTAPEKLPGWKVHDWDRIWPSGK